MLPGQASGNGSYHSYLVDTEAKSHHSCRGPIRGIWHPGNATGTECTTEGMFIAREYVQISDATGRCVSGSSGTYPFKTYPCDGEASQLFYFDNNTIKHDARPGKCVTLRH